MGNAHTRTHTLRQYSSSNPGSVICRFQPAALLWERLMAFKRVRNDDHPHKRACQIQDRVLEPHFTRGDYLFQSAGGNINICRNVNHTAASARIVRGNWMPLCSPLSQTLLEASPI